jgi:hypothetical protein
MNRVTRRFGLLAGTGTLVALSLAGCIYSSSEKEKVVAAPAPPVVAQSAERVVTYPEGRWQLHGDGTTASPYYWVWVPAGSSPPPPPPLPRR